MEEVNQNMDSKNFIIKDDEIDLIEIAKTIWSGRILILKVTAIFFVLGLIIAFGSNAEYEANCKLLPESQERVTPNLGGLGGLAGLAGINLDMNSNGLIKPKLYPEIAESTPFLLKISEKPIHFEVRDTTVSSYNYFKNVADPSLLNLVIKYTIGIPNIIKCWFRSSEDITFKQSEGDSVMRLSRDDISFLKSFKKRISIEIESETGIILLSARMPDPVAAAQLTEQSVGTLTNYITDYKTQNVQKNYNFILERHEEARLNFETTQEKVALFNDMNRNIVTSYAQTESQRLQNEYNIAFEIYKQLSTQLEQAKINLKEATPTFTILEPIKVPVYKESPKRKLILLISIVAGLFFGIIVFITKNFFNK